MEASLPFQQVLHCACATLLKNTLTYIKRYVNREFGFPGLCINILYLVTRPSADKDHYS
jgi:hypothetical protein